MVADVPGSRPARPRAVRGPGRAAVTWHRGHAGLPLRGFLMLLVHQKGLFDCGLAIAATVARITYEAVLDRLITGLTADSPLRPLVLWRTLHDVTNVNWCMQELGEPWQKLSACPLPDSPTVVLLQRLDASRHYVVVCADFVYDPLLAG